MQIIYKLTLESLTVTSPLFHCLLDFFIDIVFVFMLISCYADACCVGKYSRFYVKLMNKRTLYHAKEINIGFNFN